MPRFESDIDARRLGEALAALRRIRGLSQAEAGERVGITSQGWGLYEAGKRPGLFRPDVQRRLTAAVDATPEALAQRLTRVQPAASLEPAASGLHSAGRAWSSPAPPETLRLQLSTDDLAPWAASGVTLEYMPGRWPRRDQGCVIELDDGQRLVRLYERAEADVLVVRGGPGGLAAEERIPRARARAVSAVIARLDH
ncbi:helix-turn-helix transcriptional regulator [Brevundimonas lenta]|uniref:Transcriptional regulator with XRE-family HTH domain n=1 Tax=Brevundimonas lenta TaxID=424796 RepID=A0A7W6NNH2_9CAUL|nr:helix-turn-helix transcriptional regulator [Brevundimonas lenta]MBB4081469.1 transcriptional regulator with XRE-family HTH domain [Brevundimonas lenta]